MERNGHRKKLYFSVLKVITWQPANREREREILYEGDIPGWEGAGRSKVSPAPHNYPVKIRFELYI